MSALPLIVLVECEDALYLVEIGETAAQDQIAGREARGRVPERFRPLGLVPAWAGSRLVDVDAVGSTVALLLDRRPPLMVSHDRGVTWNERGAGLPKGKAIALAANPDHMLFAARNRMYASSDGGRFWRSLSVEVPEIRDVSWG